MLLTTRIPAASSPTGTDSANASHSRCVTWTKYEPATATIAEEQEHEHLAQALVAVRPWTAGVGDAGQDRRGADEQQLPAGDGYQVGAEQHREPERHVGRDQHLLGWDEPARGDPDRSEPVLGVGPAPRVGVVVTQIGPDLDEDRAEQRGDEPKRVKDVLEAGQRGADQHRGDGRGQRPRARRHQPDPHPARGRGGGLRHGYGRRGNFEKSTGRFSR